MEMQKARSQFRMLPTEQKRNLSDVILTNIHRKPFKNGTPIDSSQSVSPKKSVENVFEILDGLPKKDRRDVLRSVLRML